MRSACASENSVQSVGADPVAHSWAGLRPESLARQGPRSADRGGGAGEQGSAALLVPAPPRLPSRLLCVSPGCGASVHCVNTTIFRASKGGKEFSSNAGSSQHSRQVPQAEHVFVGNYLR